MTARMHLSDPYSQPGGSPADRADVARVIAVLTSVVLCVVGSLWGSGVFGGPSVEDQAGGALAGDATLLAPAGPAFFIWSVIYLGLLVYAGWQALPAQRSAPRHRAIGWWAAGSMLLNAAWLLVVRAGWLWLSVLVIGVLAVVLGIILRRCTDQRPIGIADGVIVDGTFGMYLGWVSVATCANVTAALKTVGVDPDPALAQLAAVVVLAVAAALALVLARVGRGNLGVGLAMAWGLGWIAYGRAAGEPSSAIVAVAAILAAVVAVVAALWYSTRRRQDWVDQPDRPPHEQPSAGEKTSSSGWKPDPNAVN